MTWKNPWTGKRHTQRFEDEATATIFEKTQIQIAEKAILKKEKKRRSESKRYVSKTEKEHILSIVKTTTS